MSKYLVPLEEHHPCTECTKIIHHLDTVDGDDVCNHKTTLTPEQRMEVRSSARPEWEAEDLEDDFR